MSPLQLFLLQNFVNDLSGSVSLIEFMDCYLDTLDGTEDSRWHDKAHVLATLSRSFTIAPRCGQRYIIGIVFKSVVPSAPELMLAGV